MIKLNNKQKKMLIRIIISLVLFFLILIPDKIINLSSFLRINNSWILPFGLYLAVYLLIGYDVLIKAFRNIINGYVFDENFLMCIATIGAFSLAIYRGVNHLEIEGFDEACAVLLFYQVGEFFQGYAVGKSRKSISSLMDIRPDVANVIRDGQVKSVDPENVMIDEVIVVNPGEKIPLDGVVVKGFSTLNTSSLTGESRPVSININDDVISGAINIESTLEIKVNKTFYDSTVSKILELVENATDQKSKAENFITKFARYYTPIVVILALMLAVIPSIITKNPSIWIYRALSFLVVSCPCALVISIPLSFFVAIGTSSKYGILVKGSNYIEKLNKSNIFVFDKTGTLTKGIFNVIKVSPQERHDEIIKLASIAEANSNHPIAKSIKEYSKINYNEDYVLTNVSGCGVIAKGKDTIYCGNETLMKDNNIDFIKEYDFGTIVYVAKNNEFIGSILISDEIKENSKEVISELNKNACKTIMLTGDNQIVANDIAKKLSIKEYKSSLLPQDKVYCVEEMLKNKGKDDVLCFVGDGINDAPVLMRSDIGISMGGIGSDAAIEASDIVLMKDDLKSLLRAKKIAKKTMRIVIQNIVFALGVKGVILILSAFGLSNMWIAVFGDVGVAVIAILNAIRVNSKY